MPRDLLAESGVDLLAERAARLKAQEESDRKEYDPAAGQGGVNNFLTGVGKAAYDAARGLGQVVGLTSREDVAAARKADEALMNTGAGMAGDITGNIALMLAPGGVLKLAGGAARAAGAAEAAGALSKAGGALLAPKSIPAALAVGGGMGAVQPSTSTEETLLNTGIGAVASAAVPALVKAGKVVKSTVEPFYDKGQRQILGRAYNRAAGTEADALAARTALETAGELVPGSAPTAGQASGNAGIAALERTATAIEPAATTAHAERMAAQNAARVASLEEVAGEPGKKALFEADRATVAKQLYDTAYEKGINITRNPETGHFLSKAEIAARKGEVTKLLSRPAIQDAVKEARVLAANEGVRMTDLAGSVKGLDYVQRALSDKIEKATGNEKRIFVALRDRLLTTIDALSPDYKAARTMYADMSKPINEMQVGERIADQALDKMTGQIQPRKFAASLKDQTAATATGFRGATLENTVSPENIARLNAIKADLQRALFAQNAGRGPGSDTVQKLAYSNFIDAAGVPTFIRNAAPAQITGNIASRAADALYGRANKELAARLAKSGLEPQEVAQMMKLASQPGNEKLLEIIAGGGSTLGRTAALALVNSKE